MIATTAPHELLVRVAAPLAWRSRARTAQKLHGFSATEAGSALDMWKAAELCEDPALRRLFFTHALDEARHARMFRAAARRVAAEAALAGAAPSTYDEAHATRQNLYQRLGLVEFVAFVYLAERAGAAQFRALARHFVRRHPRLHALFARIADEERAHVDYSRALLDGWRRAGRGGEVRAALLRVRGRRALEAWRRLGRVVGDRLSVLCLQLVYLIVLPLFALVARRAEPRRTGWQAAPVLPAAAPGALARARRQF